MQCPGGACSIRCAGGHRLCRESADRLHGRGGHCRSGDGDCSSAGCRLWRIHPGRKAGGCPQGCSSGYGNPENPPQADGLGSAAVGADVCFHGAYDVELAAARLVCRQSCGNRTGTAAAGRVYPGSQPELFHQRLQKSLAALSQYGYPGGTGCRRILCLECIRAVCHDRCSAARGYGQGDDLYGSAVF